eukprot:6073053-Heterocapsa_arctica.AAC.1
MRWRHRVGRSGWPRLHEDLCCGAVRRGPRRGAARAAARRIRVDVRLNVLARFGVLNWLARFGVLAAEGALARAAGCRCRRFRRKRLASACGVYHGCKLPVPAAFCVDCVHLRQNKGLHP